MSLIVYPTIKLSIILSVSINHGLRQTWILFHTANNLKVCQSTCTRFSNIRRIASALSVSFGEANVLQPSIIYRQLQKYEIPVELGRCFWNARSILFPRWKDTLQTFAVPRLPTNFSLPFPRILSPPLSSSMTFRTSFRNSRHFYYRNFFALSFIVFFFFSFFFFFASPFHFLSHFNRVHGKQRTDRSFVRKISNHDALWSVELWLKLIGDRHLFELAV